jgi:HSP20 family protein
MKPPRSPAACTARKDPIPLPSYTKESAIATFLQKRPITDPLAFMRRITEELDRVFGPREDFAWMPELYPRMWAPQLEVFERNQKFVVRVDLPGLKKDEVKIEVTHDELTIEGERKLEEEEKKEEGLYRTERTYGKFFRRIEIPEYVKAEQAVATFKNGVLEIEMPVIPVPEVKRHAPSRGARSRDTPASNRRDRDRTSHRWRRRD